MHKNLPHSKWRIVILICLAVLLRIYLIFEIPWANNSDLINYYWDGEQVVNGANPYELWANGESGNMRADIPPLELLLLSAIVYIAPSPISIRLFFVLFDGLALGLLAYYYRQTPRDQWAWLMLYGFGLAPLYMFTLTPVDRPLLWSLILLTLILISSKNKNIRYLASITIGLLGAIKWIGIFIGFPVLMHVAERKWKRLIFLGGIAALIFISSHILWYPTWQVVYDFRAARMDLRPFHTGIAVVLQWLGIHMPPLYQPLMIVSWIATQIAWWYKKITLPQAVALSFAASVYWASDVTPQMLWFITMLLLLGIQWSSWPRMILVWGFMIFETVLFALGAGYPYQEQLSIDRFFSWVDYGYGSVQMSFFSQFLVWLCFGWLIYDQMQKPSRKSERIKV